MSLLVRFQYPIRNPHHSLPSESATGFACIQRVMMSCAHAMSGSIIRGRLVAVPEKLRGGLRLVIATLIWFCTSDNSAAFSAQIVHRHLPALALGLKPLALRLVRNRWVYNDCFSIPLASAARVRNLAAKAIESPNRQPYLFTNRYCSSPLFREFTISRRPSRSDWLDKINRGIRPGHWCCRKRR
jgi:hypothetical protein